MASASPVLPPEQTARGVKAQQALESGVAADIIVLFTDHDQLAWVRKAGCQVLLMVCSCRIVRAFLIEEQKIVKKVVKLQQQQKAGQA
jgi:hypothetical protein